MTTGNPDLSIPEIAELAKVSERTVRNWFDTAKLAVSRTEQRGQQRRRYAKHSDVEAFLHTLGIEIAPGAPRSPDTAPAST